MDIQQIFMQLLDKYMENNKKILCSILFLLLVINANAQGPNLGQQQAFSSFQIPNNVESDLGYGKLLGRYITLAMMNESCISLHKDSLMSLYARSSFRNTILYLCDSTNYVNTNFLYENIDRWEENLPNLLSYCHDPEIRYAISDSLLTKGYNTGLLAMWDSCNTNRLCNYIKYRDKQIEYKKIYLLGDLAIISYNSKNKNEYNYLINFIKNTDKKFYRFIKKLSAKKGGISYYEYMADFNDYMCK